MVDDNKRIISKIFFFSILLITRFAVAIEGQLMHDSKKNNNCSALFHYECPLMNKKKRLSNRISYEVKKKPNKFCSSFISLLNFVVEQTKYKQQQQQKS